MLEEKLATKCHLWEDLKGYSELFCAKICIIPVRRPHTTPPINPRIVFPSPSNLRLSDQHLPPSMGIPPPTAAAAEFGTYAGSITQIADEVTSKRSKIIDVHS